jgi:hypothetical protein
MPSHGASYLKFMTYLIQQQGIRRKTTQRKFFYICGSVHHQSILLNKQRDTALTSRIYSSLQGYCTSFACFLLPSSGIQLKLQMQS